MAASDSAGSWPARDRKTRRHLTTPPLTGQDETGLVEAPESIESRDLPARTNGPTTWPACHLTALPAASKVARAGATRRRPRSQRSDAASQRELAIVSVQPRKGESRCALR